MFARYHPGYEIEGRPGSHDPANKRKHRPPGMSVRSSADQKADCGRDRQCGERIVLDALYPVPASPPLPARPR